IIRNLVTNAIRYGGNQVHVEYAESDVGVVLTVRDNGSEIPPTERERIFLPYFSAHDPGALPSAVGLGLTVSRQLADMMGGRLAYSYDDGWSIFTLELPSAAQLEPADVEPVGVTVSS
ncbi:MAG TPA: ATP-binding protein, partial [Acidimicrobiia bacterium]|nr:ATP-binding protein [Acidimicrobiia bacterium]